MHCDAMICTHSNVITHCDVTMDVPSNIVIHCNFTMGIPGLEALFIAGNVVEIDTPSPDNATCVIRNKQSVILHNAVKFELTVTFHDFIIFDMKRDKIYQVELCLSSTRLLQELNKCLTKYYVTFYFIFLRIRHQAI